LILGKRELRQEEIEAAYFDVISDFCKSFDGSPEQIREWAGIVKSLHPYEAYECLGTLPPLKASFYKLYLETDDGNLKALLVPYPADQMHMWEISLRVNSPKNDDPSLWEPLHGEPTQTTTDTLGLLRE